MLKAFAFATATLLLTACSADFDTAEPLGQPQPLTFSVAGGADAVTRAAADSEWDGGEEVAIRVGGVVHKYVVVSGGGLSPATPGDMFYRSSTADIAVEAWYPYSPTKPSTVTVADDQSSDADFEASNLMEASATAVFGSSTSLVFNHLTARITVNLKDQSDVAIGSGADVTISGITAHNDDNAGQYSVLVAPTTIASGTRLVAVTYGGNSYAYETDADIELDEGRSALYNIRLGDVGPIVYDLITDAHNNGSGHYVLTIPAGQVCEVVQSVIGPTDHVIEIGAGAIVTLKGVDIYNGEVMGITCLGSAEIILEDGFSNSVASTGYGSSAILNGGSGTTLTVSGTGTLDAECGYFGTCIGNGAGNVVINGGTLNLNAGGQAFAPAIGAAQSKECGDITINGGTLTLRGGDEGPGIGTCDGLCGVITINGGDITAQASGNYGAPGIGAAQGGTCGDIVITGGSVNATGAADGWTNYKGGAGIGTGWNSICGNITISGGTVVASGRSYAAGIGTSGRELDEGNLCQCGNITISGTANVTASRQDSDTKFCIGVSSTYDDDKIICGTVTVDTSVLNDSGEGGDTRTITPKP